MAVLTELRDDDARRLGRLYGLDVVSARGVLAGSVNSNFELALARGGRVFLRVYEEQKAGSASGEAALLDHLAANGVPTPRPLARDGGGFIAEHAGKPVALFPWVDGEALCQARVDAGRAFRVGEALARVHRIAAGFRGRPASRFGPRDLAARLGALVRRGSISDEVAALLPDLAHRVDVLVDRTAASPDGIIHGDLFRDNVLWSGDEIAALLDFESASLGTYAFDLMVTVLAWCVGDALDAELARAMYAGYVAVRPEGAGDAYTLHEAATYAALRFTITRITDYEMRPRGLGVYKDFRRFLARLRAVDALGPKGLADLLGVA
jgi:homoserine kinase type II